MKMKIYYGALLLIWLLSSCSFSVDGSNVASVSVSPYGGGVKSMQIHGHTYYYTYYWFSHAGDCPKCKQELDCTIRKAVKEAMNDGK